MGNELFCEFRISSHQGSTYWWPLVFEAMHWESFTFTAPGEPEGKGYYYYIRQGNEADTDFVKATFKEAWDEIHAETSQMLVSFWHVNGEPFPLDVSLEKQEGNTIVVLLSLNDAYLIDLLLEEAKQRVKIFLSCAKRVYSICKPSRGKIFWEILQAPFAWIGDSSELLPFTDRRAEEARAKLTVENLADGSSLYVLDPAPLKVRGGWDFVSLLA